MSAKSYRICLAVLSALVLVLLFLLANRQLALSRVEADIRFARDIVWSIHAARELALKSEPRAAALALQRIEESAGPKFQNPIADFVDRERRRAITDIISYLRTKTGQDLGSDPEVWVERYAHN